MQNGLAMKAQQRDLVGRRPARAKSARTRFAWASVTWRSASRMACGTGRPRPPAGPHPVRFSAVRAFFAHRGWSGRPGDGDIAAIGFQQGGVNPVQRGAAHQAYHFLNLSHSCYCRLSVFESIACKPRRIPVRILRPSWRAVLIMPARIPGKNWTISFQKERVTAYIGFDLHRQKHAHRQSGPADDPAAAAASGTTGRSC